MKFPTKEDLPLMPSFPGLGLLYPGGAPIPMSNMHYEGKSYEDIKRAFIMFRVDKGPALEPVELEILQQYLVYYVHAPLFNLDKELWRFNAPLRALAWKIKPNVESIDNFLHRAMDFGLDPF